MEDKAQILAHIDLQSLQLKKKKKKTSRQTSKQNVCQQADRERHQQK